jgi:RNA polymerase sigma-70 factor, ECF subfamily
MANDSASTGAATPREPASGKSAAGPPSAGAPRVGVATPSVETPSLDVARLVQEHQTGVWRYLRVLGCSAAEAEDITQEIFLAVLTKPFQDYNRQATAAYLRQVARNLFISSRRRAVAVAELDEAEAAWLRWAAKDDGQELLSALQSCLQNLTERARQALDLRFSRQCSRAEIAAALSLSEDGAKNLLQRAKQQLRACIEKAVAQERGDA